MKYERLTYEEDNKIKYHGYSNLITNRLFELENKIESGELISTKEVGDTEIEFFVKHNDSIRKETAQEIFFWFWRNLVNLNFITGNIEVNFGALQNFAKTYGVELFGISNKLEGNK